MKRQLIISICILTTLIFASCSVASESIETADILPASTFSESVYTEQAVFETTIGIVEPTTKTSFEDEIPEAYITLIDEFCTAVSNGEDRSENFICQRNYYDLCTYDGIEIGIYDIDWSDPLVDNGYCIKGLDSNGTPELIIGSVGTDELPPVVYDIYTLDTVGCPVRYFVSWSRSLKYLYADGYVVDSGSGGAAHQGMLRYKIDGTELVLESRIDKVSGTYTLCYSNEEFYSICTSDRIDPDCENIVSEEHVEEWTNELECDPSLEFTPFILYWG